MKCERYECENWDKNLCLKPEDVFITDMGNCGIFEYAAVPWQEIEDRKKWQFDAVFGDLLK